MHDEYASYTHYLRKRRAGIERERARARASERARDGDRQRGRENSSTHPHFDDHINGQRDKESFGLDNQQTLNRICVPIAGGIQAAHL
jgi:hypothetical protein